MNQWKCKCGAVLKHLTPLTYFYLLLIEWVTTILYIDCTLRFVPLVIVTLNARGGGTRTRDIEL